jgi:hypothetical protein
MHKVLTENLVFAPGRAGCWGVGRTPTQFLSISRLGLVVLCRAALPAIPDLNPA